MASLTDGVQMVRAAPRRGRGGFCRRIRYQVIGSLHQSASQDDCLGTHRFEKLSLDKTTI